MTNDEYIAKERYLYDPYYHKIVEMLERCISEEKIYPDELHEAVKLATLRAKERELYEMEMNLRRYIPEPPIE